MSIKKIIFKFGTLALILMLLTTGFSYAQRLTGKIVGQVTDTEGAPLPGVTVEISGPALMGGVHAQVTSERGYYRFINLPPGTYKVVFKLAGFQTIERENLIASVGKTVTENIVLKQVTLEESITVTAESPVVDVTKSGMSTTYGKDELEKIPAGRYSMYDIIKQHPGIQQTGEDSDRMVSFGSNSESNSFRLDGVELSDPDIGIAWRYIPQDMLAEVETLGIGTPAEFGQFTGAVINVVTKSGGNRFEGAISYYGQFQALTDDNNPIKKLDPDEVPAEEAYLYPDSAYSFDRGKFLYLSFSLGGPIIKDKLWFFGSYERSDEKVSYLGMHPDYAVEWPADKAFFKLSAQLTKRHQLGGYFYYENFDYPDYIDPWTAPEALGSEIGYVVSWNFVYTWQISNNAYFDLKYAGFWNKDDYLPDNGDMDSSPIWDMYTGEVWGGFAYMAWKWKVSRHQAHANLSYYAEDFLGGDHDFKIGVQFNRGDSRYPIAYAGEAWLYYWDGYPYYMYQQDVWYVGGVVDSFGGFVDDSWKIGDRLTVNLGLRFDFQNASVPELPIMDGWTETSEKSPSVKDVVTWNALSPRIGLAFQLTSDQKTLLKATYGRYYDALLMSNWVYPGPNVTDQNVYYYDWDIEDWVLWYTIPGEAGYTVDENLKNPYADQFSLGLERELLPDFSAGATFIYKKQKDLLGMIDRGGTYEKISVVSEDDGRTYEVWNQTNVGTKDIFLTNVKDYFGVTYEQIYTAVIFTLTKRYSNNWMMNASLTLSKSEGINMIGHNTGSWQQAMVWYSGGFGQDPNDLTNAYGRMINDRPWIFKIQAGYTFPWGILASLNYIYQAGRPAPTLIWVNLDQGWQKILTEPRGEERFPNWSMLDFRLQKTFDIHKTVRLSAIFDLFNVFNADTVTSYASYEMWQTDIYQVPSGNFNPRRIQIGLKLEF